MKNNTARRKRAGKAAPAALSAMMLIAGAGCTCTTINMVPPQQAALQPVSGPRPSLPLPPGGNLFPATASVSGTLTTWTICSPGQSVTKKKAIFYPPFQGPAAGETLFRGWIRNTTAGTILSNNTYVLQWVNPTTGDQGCASKVPTSTSDVTFSVAYPNQYGMTAHFKVGGVPNATHTLELNGVWTTP